MKITSAACHKKASAFYESNRLRMEKEDIRIKDRARRRIEKALERGYKRKRYPYLSGGAILSRYPKVNTLILDWNPYYLVAKGYGKVSALDIGILQEIDAKFILVSNPKKRRWAIVLPV